MADYDYGLSDVNEFLNGHSVDDEIDEREYRDDERLHAEDEDE